MVPFLACHSPHHGRSLLDSNLSGVFPPWHNPPCPPPLAARQKVLAHPSPKGLLLRAPANTSLMSQGSPPRCHLCATFWCHLRATDLRTPSGFWLLAGFWRIPIKEALHSSPANYRLLSSLSQLISNPSPDCHGSLPFFFHLVRIFSSWFLVSPFRISTCVLVIDFPRDNTRCVDH